MKWDYKKNYCKQRELFLIAKKIPHHKKMSEEEERILCNPVPE